MECAAEKLYEDVLIEVFKYLDPQSLRETALVCKK